MQHLAFVVKVGKPFEWSDMVIGLDVDTLHLPCEAAGIEEEPMAWETFLPKSLIEVRAIVPESWKQPDCARQMMLQQPDHSPNLVEVLLPRKFVSFDHHLELTLNVDMDCRVLAPAV